MFFSKICFCSDEFSDNLPYKVGTRNTANLRCYFLVNPAKTYTFSTTYKYADADAQRQWDNFAVSSSSNTVNAGKYCVVTTPTPKFKNLGRFYSYSATVIPQTFSPIVSGLHQFQCWGAAGGGSLDDGTLYANTHCLGGYVTGDISLTVGARTYYLAVGQKGGNGAYSQSTSTGGWPGGGTGSRDKSDDERGGGGGGFSAIYLETFTSSTATAFDKLKTRIMVAGAGGGSTWAHVAYGYKGCGGGIEGTSSASATAGTQDSGNAFGIGQNANSIGLGTEGGDVGAGGGGGGYWGGKACQSNSALGRYDAGTYCGGGGSSFASGMTGCKAITETSTSSSISYRTGSDATIHYSGLKFTNASTIAGNASMPNPAAATGNITGNPNNG